MSDHVDELLRAAGERWRAAQPPAPEPDSGRWPTPTPTPAPAPARPRRRWVPVAAAAGATLIAAAAVSLVVREPAPVLDRVVTVDGPVDLVVRDGDVVRASGMVQFETGRATRFCPPAVDMAVGYGVERGPSCRYSVPVLGVDPARLSDPRQIASVRFGYATLEGVWDDGTLRITAQGPAPATLIAEDTEVPCPTPGGGWPGDGAKDDKDLYGYVAYDHPDRFGQPWLGRPAGTIPGTGPAVMVVSVVGGDPAAARQDLAAHYAGNLCLVHAPGEPSLAARTRTLAAVRPELDRLMTSEANGIYARGHPTDTSVELVVLTPDRYEQLDRAGVTGLDLRPWLRPAG